MGTESVAGHLARLAFQGGMSFDVELGGHHLVLDADAGVGGADRGPRPKDLLLAGLGGCTGMDVVALLRNRKASFDALEVRVEGDTAVDHPKVFTAIRLEYRFTGSELDVDKIRRAVSLSLERYCAVTAMLSRAAEITHRIVLNGQVLQEQTPGAAP